MSDWRCQECHHVLTVENDDELMFAVLDHPCVPNPSWLKQATTWAQQRIAALATSAGATENDNVQS